MRPTSLVTKSDAGWIESVWTQAVGSLAEFGVPMIVGSLPWAISIKCNWVFVEPSFRPPSPRFQSLKATTGIIIFMNLARGFTRSQSAVFWIVVLRLG